MLCEMKVQILLEYDCDMASRMSLQRVNKFIIAAVKFIYILITELTESCLERRILKLHSSFIVLHWQEV